MIIYRLSADLYIVTGHIVQLMFFLIYYLCSSIYYLLSLFFIHVTAVALLTLRRK